MTSRNILPPRHRPGVTIIEVTKLDYVDYCTRWGFRVLVIYKDTSWKFTYYYPIWGIDNIRSTQNENEFIKW